MTAARWWGALLVIDAAVLTLARFQHVQPTLFEIVAFISLGIGYLDARITEQLKKIVLHFDTDENAARAIRSLADSARSRGFTPTARHADGRVEPFPSAAATESDG